MRNLEGLGTVESIDRGQVSISRTKCLAAMERMAEKYWNIEEWGDEDWEDEDWDDENWDGEEQGETGPEAEALKEREKELWAKCMKIACSQIVKEEYENRPEDIGKHVFSAEFHEKMNKLMRVAELSEKPKEKPKSGSVLTLMRPIRSKRMAIAMVAVMLLLFGTTVGGTNPIIVWMYENWLQQHGDYVELQNREYGEEIEEETFRKYELTKIPEGYHLESEIFLEGIRIYYMYYTDENGQAFIFEQSKKDNGNLGTITANREDLEKVEFGEFEGYYFKDDDTKNLVLSDEEYTLLFIGDFSKEEFLAIAEGLYVKE